MKNLIKKIASKMILILPKWTLKNYIVFESAPDFADNTRAVFDEMIRRGLNKKYKMIWLVNRLDNTLGNIPNVKYVLKTSKSKFKYLLFAKCGVCCNGKVYAYRKGQFSIYLGHGTTVKSVRQSMPPMGDKITCWLATSENMKELFGYQFRADLDRGVALGYPRNDVLTEPKKDLHDYFEGDFEKVIVWYPTFRQNIGGISASDSSDALPIIENHEIAKEINEVAYKNKVLIVMKPHFAQDVSYITELNLSNFVMIDDNFLHKNNLLSYQLVAATDALLTDYSSIYFDYTLVDKPIGLTWPDYKLYEKNPGFAIDMNHYMKGGEKIYTKQDLCGFITSVSENEDNLLDPRREIRDEVHFSTDGKNSERVVDFIIEKAGL